MKATRNELRGTARKLVAVFLATFTVAALLGGGTSAADDYNPQPPVKVYVDGILQRFPDQKPIIENDRVLTPMRVIFEALSMAVEWDGDARTVTAAQGDVTIQFKIDEASVTRNGLTIPIDVAPRILGDRTLVPLRAIAESFEGSRIDWVNATHSVYIISAEKLRQAAESGKDYDRPSAVASYAEPTQIGDPGQIAEPEPTQIGDTAPLDPEGAAGVTFNETFLGYVGQTYNWLKSECGGSLTNIVIQDVPVSFFNNGVQAFYRGEAGNPEDSGGVALEFPDNYLSTDIVVNANQFFYNENTTYAAIKAAFSELSALPTAPTDYDASGSPIYSSTLKYNNYILLISFVNQDATLVTITKG
jgi:hypothetical protein